MTGVQSPHGILIRLSAIEAFKANAHRLASSMYTEYLILRANTPLTPAVGAMGPGTERFRGYADNTEFGNRLPQLIDGR